MSDYLHQEIIQEPRYKKKSFQSYIKRLIIYFFVIMLALTFVSRAADSVLVAKVSLTSAKKGELTFKFMGSGRIIENEKQYLDVYQGLHISKVFVQEGDRVRQGDPLFQYDLKELDNKYKEAKNDILKAELNYKKAKLSSEQLPTGTEAEAAELALHRAEQELSLARQELQISMDRVTRKMKESCEAAQEEYEAALAAYNEQELKMNRAINQANKQLQKALNARAELDSERKAAEAVLRNYRSIVEGLSQNPEDILSSIYGKTDSTKQYNLNYMISDVNQKFYSILNSLNNDIYYYFNPQAVFEQNEQAVINSEVPASQHEETDKLMKTVEGIFQYYYGEEVLKKHKKEVEAAEKHLERTKEDYSCAVVFAYESGRNLTMEDMISHIRQYEDAIYELEEMTKEDRILQEAIVAYGKAIIKKDKAEIDNTYADLFSLIYREDKAKASEIKTADNAVEAAGEAVSEVLTEWTEIMAKEHKKVEDLLSVYEEKKAIYQQMLDGSYDYTEEVYAEEKLVEAAVRAVEAAKVNVERANESDYRLMQKQQRDKEIEKLDYKLYKLELEVMYETAAELEEMLKQEGKVTAPADGYAVNIGLEERSITTGNEKVVLALDGCSLQIYVTKEEAKRMEVGDEIKIKTGRQKENIAVIITDIGWVDEDGKVKITGAMPEGEYSIGAEVNYEYTKKTKQYPLTIPITALHADSRGNYYVLIPEENNTVLGNELIARKIAVTLIDKCDTVAAIDGNLYSVKIISESNKIIDEGDRIRLVEDIFS